MAEKANIASVVVGVVYVAAGALKVFEFNEPLTQILTFKFSEFAQVFPLRPLGLIPDGACYLRTTGILELLLGLGLGAGTPRIKRLSSAGLMVIMAVAIQTLLCKGAFMSALNPLVFFLILRWIYRSMKNLKPKPK